VAAAKPQPEPKRHHHVPRAYLERFAAGQRLYVRRRDGATFEANPINVAVESGSYDISDAEGRKSAVVEKALARYVEGPAWAAFEMIDRTRRPPPVGSAEREALAHFMALQMTRTTLHREMTLFPVRVTEWAGAREVTKDLVAEYLSVEHLHFDPAEPEVEGAWTHVAIHLQDTTVLTPEFAIQTMLVGAAEIADRMMALNWTVETDRRRRFITSDVPVTPWKPVTREDHFRGMGIGSAEEMRFPLDPGKQLVLSRRSRKATIEAEPHRVKRSNADLAGACHRFITAGVGSRNLIDRQRLDRWAPVVRFWTGPLFVSGPNGERQEAPGEVTQMWTPRASWFGRPQRLRQ
jgi:hypothetical protein